MLPAHELSETECERLLRGGIVGRVGMTAPSGQHIIVVNYSVVEDAVVVRTAPDSILGRFGAGTAVAFEIDQIDYADQRGWSVVAKGHVAAVTDPDDVERIRRLWPPRPWASGDRSLLLAIRWEELSGRRLGAGWSDRDVPVRRVLAAEPHESL